MHVTEHCVSLSENISRGTHQEITAACKDFYYPISILSCKYKMKLFDCKQANTHKKLSCVIILYKYEMNIAHLDN